MYTSISVTNKKELPVHGIATFCLEICPLTIWTVMLPTATGTAFTVFLAKRKKFMLYVFQYLVSSLNFNFRNKSVMCISQ